MYHAFCRILFFLSNKRTEHVNSICFLKLFYLGDHKAFEGIFIREKTDEIAQRACVLHYNKALGHTALSFQ
jgi:hypothetical protein